MGIPRAVIAEKVSFFGCGHFTAVVIKQNVCAEYDQQGAVPRPIIRNILLIILPQSCGCFRQRLPLDDVIGYEAA